MRCGPDSVSLLIMNVLTGASVSKLHKRWRDADQHTGRTRFNRAALAYCLDIDKFALRSPTMPHHEGYADWPLISTVIFSISPLGRDIPFLPTAIPFASFSRLGSDSGCPSERLPDAAVSDWLSKVCDQDVTDQTWSLDSQLKTQVADIFPGWLNLPAQAQTVRTSLEVSSTAPTARTEQCNASDAGVDLTLSKTTAAETLNAADERDLASFQARSKTTSTLKRRRRPSSPG